MSKCERKKRVILLRPKLIALLKLEKMSLIAHYHVTSMISRFRDDKSVKKCFFNFLYNTTKNQDDWICSLYNMIFGKPHGKRITVQRREY